LGLAAEWQSSRIGGGSRVGCVWCYGIVVLVGRLGGASVETPCLMCTVFQCLISTVESCQWSHMQFRSWHRVDVWGPTISVESLGHAFPVLYVEMGVYIRHVYPGIGWRWRRQILGKSRGRIPEGALELPFRDIMILRGQTPNRIALPITSIPSTTHPRLSRKHPLRQTLR